MRREEKATNNRNKNVTLEMMIRGFFCLIILNGENRSNAFSRTKFIPQMMDRKMRLILRTNTGKLTHNQHDMFFRHKCKCRLNLSSTNDINDAGGGNSRFFDAIHSEENSQSSKYTHMIGIPFEENRDLLLELESVQRAILYHCPLLIHACIVPVMTRMPLLYVETAMSTGGLGVNSEDVTDILNQIVQDVVNKYINVVSVKSNNDEYGSVGGLNDDGIKPVMMKFKGLELDGKNCDVLHAIGTNDCDGSNLIRKVLLEIQNKIEERGWKTILPSDKPQGEKEIDPSSGAENWRPRLPFMRLPHDFQDTLPPLPDGQEDYRLPEDGGNGISPIFWYKWWEDEFTKDDGVRLREIGIYTRSGPWGLTEKAFYTPSLTVKLPLGNDILTKSEERDKEYAESRLKEQLGEEEAVEEINLSKEISDAKEQYAIERQSSIQSTQKRDTTYLQKEKKWDEENIQNGASTYFIGPDNSQPRKPGDPIVRTIGTPSPKPSISSSTISTSPKKSIEDIENIDLDEGIIRIRNMLKQKPTPAADSKQKNNKIDYSMYPSDEHFVGIWRIVSSPNKNIYGNDSLMNIVPDSSENLVLRVDGGVAGGPMLNQLDKQKAAGGNWKMFQARWAGGGDMPEMEQTRLRIKLIIPPEKNDFLVMEGKVTRVMMPRGSSSLSLNLNSNNEVTDYSDVENKDSRNDYFLHCEGEVWVQDIEGTGKRTKLGRFTAMKLDSPRQGSLRYTVPPPKPFSSE